MIDHRTLVVICGADSWPNLTQFKAPKKHPAFFPTAEGLRKWLLETAGLPEENLLNYFNKPIAGNILTGIIKEIGDRLKAWGRPHGDGVLIMFIYVGHGAVYGPGRDYCLLLTDTQEGIEDATSLRTATVLAMLEKIAPMSSRLLVLDSCFAARAAGDAYQGPGDLPVDPGADLIAAHPHEPGVALMCASSYWEQARVHPNGEHTMFGGGLLSVLEAGDPEYPGRLLSPRRLVDLAYTEMLRDAPLPSRDVPKPQVHTPRQKLRNLADEPIFPNVAPLTSPEHPPAPAAEPEPEQGPTAGAIAKQSPRGRPELAVLLAAGFTLALGFLAFDLSIPAMSRDIGLDGSSAHWAITGFLVFACGLGPFFGRSMDVIGRRRLFLAGMMLLGLAYLTIGLAATPWLVVAARIAQGVATAAVAPTVLSLIATSLPAGRRRDRILGRYSALIAAGLLIGFFLFPVMLADWITWRWTFFTCAIISAGVLSAGIATLRETKSVTRLPFPTPNIIGISLVMMAAAYILAQGVTEAVTEAWSEAGTWTALVVAVVSLVAFIALERRVTHPMVSLSKFPLRTVVWCVAGALIAFTTMSFAFWMAPAAAGPLGWPFLVSVGGIIGGLFGPGIFRALGVRWSVTLGLAFQAVLAAPVLTFEPVWLGVLLLVGGLVTGFASFVMVGGSMVIAMSISGLPSPEEGPLMGLVTTAQQFGLVLGATTAYAVANTVRQDDGDSANLAFAISAMVCVIAGLVLAATFPKMSQSTAA